MYRTAVMDALATSLHVRPEALDRMMTDETAPPPTAAQQHSHAAASHSAAGGARRKTRAQHAIGLVLHYPRAANELTGLERLDELNQPGAELLRRILAIARSLAQPTTAQILENLRGDPDLKYVERLAAEEPLDSPEDAGRVLNDALNLMVQDAIKSRVGAAAGAAVRAHRPTPAD
jgi:hypothetical protein